MKVPVYFTDAAERSFAEVGKDVVHVSMAIVREVVRRLGRQSVDAELEEHDSVAYDEHTIPRTITTGYSGWDQVDTIVVVAFAWGPPRTPVLWVLETFTALSRFERNQRLQELKRLAEVMRRTPPPDE